MQQHLTLYTYVNPCALYLTVLLLLTVMHWCCQVVPHVIGKERRKQREIEEATGATLQIPPPTGKE
jgi:hypothetical protein